jgi:hypothetical protein
MAELAFISRLSGYVPYFIGFSQLDEISHGTDSYYSDGAKIGLFQFKRGYHKLHFFTFYINNNAPHFNQHNIFSGVDSVCNACRYVFPLVGTNEDVYSSRGNLIGLTAFISPRKFDPISPSNKKHRITMYENGNWVRHTDEKKGEWRNLYGKLPPETIPINEKQFEEQVGKEKLEAARTVFDKLELPNVKDVLGSIADHDNKNIEDIFKQRSSFCMIFDKS